MTDQEIMQSAKRHADGWRVTLDMDRESLCNEQQMAYDLLAAAERIRVLGEEVEAWRKRNAILTPREYERALADVVKFVAATDAARRTP